MTENIYGGAFPWASVFNVTGMGGGPSEEDLAWQDWLNYMGYAQSGVTGTDYLSGFQGDFPTGIAAYTAGADPLINTENIPTMEDLIASGVLTASSGTSSVDANANQIPDDLEVTGDVTDTGDGGEGYDSYDPYYGFWPPGWPYGGQGSGTTGTTDTTSTADAQAAADAQVAADAAQAAADAAQAEAEATGTAEAQAVADAAQAEAAAADAAAAEAAATAEATAKDEENGPIFVGPPEPPLGPPAPPVGPPEPTEETFLEKLKGADWQQILGILSLLGLGGTGLSQLAGDSTGGITGLMDDGEFADPGAAGFADMPGGGVGLPTFLGGDTSRAPIYYPFASEPTKEYNVAQGGPFSFTTGPPQGSLIQNLGYDNVPGVEYVADGAFVRRNGLTEGPGTETSDDIPAMLSDGEFVTNAEANRGIGLMTLMNQGAPQQTMMDPEQQRLAGARQMYLQQALGQQMAKKMRGG